MLLMVKKSQNNILPTFISENPNILRISPTGSRQFENPILSSQQQMGPLAYFVPFTLNQPKTASSPITAVIKPINSSMKNKRNRKRIHWDTIRKSALNEKSIRESVIPRKNESSSEIYIDEPLLTDPLYVPDPCIEDREPLTGKKYEDPQLVNRQLSNLGLGGANSYIIPFDLDTVIQNRMQADAIIDSMKSRPGMSPATPSETTIPPKVKNSIENQRPDQWIISDQYRKLVDTVESLREKRQNEERIGKLFSRQNEEDKLADLKSKNRELQDLSKVKFEKPLVFSIEN